MRPRRPTLPCLLGLEAGCSPSPANGPRYKRCLRVCRPPPLLVLFRVLMLLRHLRHLHQTLTATQLPPTSGTAYIGTHDIRTDLPGARRLLGVCPQHDVLFDDLTVEQHLRFFCRLKGLTSAAAVSMQIEDMLDSLELQAKRHAPSKTLSGGQKRRLSCGMAIIGGRCVPAMQLTPHAVTDDATRIYCFWWGGRGVVVVVVVVVDLGGVWPLCLRCVLTARLLYCNLRCGRSRVIILDEPTSGVDPAARRKIWELIVKCVYSEYLHLS